MKKNQIIFSLVLVIVLFAIFSLIKKIFFPGVYDYVRQQSGLDISNTMKVAVFINEANWTDVYRYIELDLSFSQTLDLARQCKKKGYLKLPIEEDGIKNADFIKEAKSGYYKLEFLSKTENDDVALTVLDINKRKLVIKVTII